MGLNKSPMDRLKKQIGILMEDLWTVQIWPHNDEIQPSILTGVLKSNFLNTLLIWRPHSLSCLQRKQPRGARDKYCRPTYLLQLWVCDALATYRPVICGSKIYMGDGCIHCALPSTSTPGCVKDACNVNSYNPLGLGEDALYVESMPMDYQSD